MHILFKRITLTKCRRVSQASCFGRVGCASSNWAWALHRCHPDDSAPGTGLEIRNSAYLVVRRWRGKEPVDDVQLNRWKVGGNL